MFPWRATGTIDRAPTANPVRTALDRLHAALIIFGLALTLAGGFLWCMPPIPSWFFSFPIGDTNFLGLGLIVLGTIFLAVARKVDPIKTTKEIDLFNEEIGVWDRKHPKDDV